MMTPLHSQLLRSAVVAATCLASIWTANSARAASIGAVLGLNRGAIGGDAPLNTEYGGKTGLLGGVQAEIGLGDEISLSLQPMYVRRGTSLTAADSVETSGERETELTLDYVALPVVVKFNAARGRTYVAGGLDVAFLTAARLTGEGLDEDVKSSFEDLDVGALLGFGVVFPAGRVRLPIELRYVQGLVNLSGDSASGAIADLPDRFHSSGWQLTAGILLPLGGKH